MSPGGCSRLAFAIAALLCGCGRGDVSGNPVQGAAALPAVEVRAVAVRRGPISQRITAPGSLLARRESRIGAEIRGRVERVFVSEGDRVEEGDPLFQIDRAPYEAILRQAEAGLDLARAERRQIRADLERARALQEQKIVTQQEIDRLETQQAVARARERQAKEAVALAKQDLERTLVVAPFAGSVAERLVDEGTTAQAQPQTIVLVLQETAELEAHATIPESQLQAIRIGDRAFLEVQGLDEPIETRVSAVGDTIDRASRTFFVKMRVPNEARTLKAGVFAQVEIVPEPTEDALLVPREAIRTEDGRTRVLSVRDGLAVAVPIEVGVVSGEWAEIRSGLDVGDLVVVGEAAGRIAPGMAVQLVDADGGAAS